ncbi:MAG: hypothetical protein OXI60_05815 [Acidiferrobacterales bacterium]|nr:hypothetical protein [Acidiferrobacterales bacterium]
MPTLRDVLPQLDQDDSYRDCGAYPLRDVQVIQIKLGIGAPCSSRDELFAPWPGEEADIEKWYVLDNNTAVGVKVNGDGVYEFPLYDMEQSDA